MKSLLRNIVFILILAFAFAATGCASNKNGHGKKPKCRTCPKWEDKIELNAEEHEFRDRP